MASVLDIISELPEAVDADYLADHVLERLDLDPTDFEHPGRLPAMQSFWLLCQLTERASRNVRASIRDGLLHFPDPPPSIN